MGCGCGKKSSLMMPLPVVKPSVTTHQKIIISKPINSIPNISHQSQKSVLNWNTNSIQVINGSIDPYQYFNQKRSIIIVLRQGNAEGSYIRNLISKFFSINEEYSKSSELLEIDINKVLEPEKLQSVPATIFILKKNNPKIFYGLFDVQNILEKFIKIPIGSNW